ncbi:MAG TPA: LLM class flavin-dependent oxidoreductase [Streptosporangiaceae bacterium]
MRYAVNVPNFGDFADPRVVADLARLAEQSGWDALFVWDHVTWVKAKQREIADPWILLTAAALATSRIRLGTMITPVPRRRVSVLARQVTTLDRRSGWAANGRPRRRCAAPRAGTARCRCFTPTVRAPRPGRTWSRCER